MADRPAGIDRTELIEELGRTNDGAEEDVRKLLHLGFIYDGPGKIEAGIPSLFDHILALRSLLDGDN